MPVMLLSFVVQPGAYKAAVEVTHVTSGSFHINLFHMLLYAVGHVYFSVHICVHHSCLIIRFGGTKLNFQLFTF